MNPLADLLAGQSGESLTSWLLKEVQYCFETKSTAVKPTPWKIKVQCVPGVPELTQCGERLVYLLQSC